MSQSKSKAVRTDIQVS